jgi:hypothetical protein
MRILDEAPVAEPLAGDFYAGFKLPCPAPSCSGSAWVLVREVEAPAVRNGPSPYVACPHGKTAAA